MENGVHHSERHRLHQNSNTGPGVKRLHSDSLQLAQSRTPQFRLASWSSVDVRFEGDGRKAHAAENHGRDGGILEKHGNIELKINSAIDWEIDSARKWEFAYQCFNDTLLI